MLEFSAHAFYESTMLLHHMRDMIRSWETQKKHLIKKLI
jgi:hypothetical protein